LFLVLPTVAGKGARTSKNLPPGLSRRPDSDRPFIEQGWLALKPENGAFLSSVLPRFPDSDTGRASVQILIFGIAFAVLGPFTNSALACLGGILGKVAEGNQTFHVVTRFAGGGMLIAHRVFAARMTAPQHLGI